MKIHPFFAGIIFAGCALSPLPAKDHVERWDTIIHQIDTSTQAETMMVVPEKGSGQAPADIIAFGARFELWGVPVIKGESALDKAVLVASKSVDAIDANLVVEVAGKEYAPTELAKVRSDKPFSVNLQVDGLKVPATGVNVAATKVLFVHKGYVFKSEDDIVKGANAVVTTTIKEVYVEKNGAVKLEYSCSNLLGLPVDGKSLSPFKACGIEEFFVYMLPQVAGQANTLVATAKVQITPVPPLIQLYGIKTGETYDVIPDSAWSVDIAGGTPGGAGSQSLFVVGYPKGEPAKEMLLQSSPILTSGVTKIFVETTPERNGWQQIDFQGEWTVEVLIGNDLATAERLGEPDPIYTFTVDKTIEVNGQIFSNE